MTLSKWVPVISGDGRSPGVVGNLGCADPSYLELGHRPSSVRRIHCYPQNNGKTRLLGNADDRYGLTGARRGACSRTSSSSPRSCATATAGH